MDCKHKDCCVSYMDRIIKSSLSTSRYKKAGNVVYGLPFQDGSYGMKIVKDEIRIRPMEPVLLYRKLSALDKVEAIK